MMRIYYFFFELFTHDWTDVGRDPLNSHTINISGDLIEFTPLGLILDVRETTGLMVGIIVIISVFIHNFLIGYRGEEIRPEKSRIQPVKFDPNWKSDYEVVERLRKAFYGDK